MFVASSLELAYLSISGWHTVFKRMVGFVPIRLFYRYVVVGNHSQSDTGSSGHSGW